ncbi:MAG: hypothetical protein AAF961_12040 [Planctomycetota bacterium]
MTDDAAEGKGDELHWRETYFILFPRERRPTLKEVQQALASADDRLRLENLAADEQGLFQSLLVESPEDHAAVEVSYETGDAVIEQNLEWAKQLQREIAAEHLQQLMVSDARLDVAHFERLPASTPNPDAADKGGRGAWTDDDYAADDFGDDVDAGPELGMLDPTCLLMVVEALTTLTKGITLDPASGEIL